MKTKRRLFWLIMCVINTHIWKTRAKAVIEQKIISSDVVSKHYYRFENKKNFRPEPWQSFTLGCVKIVSLISGL